MELWENEVYRFKTIGQLKVSLGWDLSRFVWNTFLPLIFSHSACRPSVSICPEGISASDQPSTRWSCMTFWRQIMRHVVLSHFTLSLCQTSIDTHCVSPQRVLRRWSANGRATFTITWRSFRPWTTTSRRTRPTELCSQLWLNCEFCWEKCNMSLSCIVGNITWAGK